MRLYKKKKIEAGPLFGIALFAICFLFFFVAIVNVSDDVDENEIKALKTAIDKAITTCYAIEGVYPENIEYIEEHYGVVIDRDKYAVIYDILGTNIKPNVVVAPLDMD